jgi:hypothetical protein
MGRSNYVHHWTLSCRRIPCVPSSFPPSFYYLLCRTSVVKWTKTGSIAIAAKNQFWGWMAFGGLVFCAILSLPAIRRSSYQLFWHSHWIGLTIMVFAVGPTLLVLHNISESRLL